MKRNYLKKFDGVKENLAKLEILIKKSDLALWRHFEKNNIKLAHFAFRWCFCCLMREFPIHLSIRLLDFFLMEDVEPGELVLYLMLTLLLKFGGRIKELHREEIILFL